MLPPIAPAFDLETLVQAATAEGSGLWDLSRATLHADGWENAVLETGDGWILRFPRDEELDFDQEIAILQHLQGRLLVRTPSVEWIGQKTRFAAYRKLTGAAFDRERYASASEFQREALASSLARFLAAMHDSMDEVEETELEVPFLDHEPTLELVVKEMRWLPASHWRHAENLIGQFATMWVGDNVPGPEVLLHNDFHTGNMVFAEPVGDLTGIWDFSNVQIGVPTFDFRYFDGAPRDLLERMAGHYQMLTQRPIDVRAAVVANRMENLFDVLQTRRMDLFDTVTARWAAADAGL
ncbi:hypothetical protein Rhe02_67070 [Rhizocola hellebori]|uniref:Aminoglycoside phosphotransferase domain-containing protein n=1 Tax=Rhizocola hellebori TaxID=1392758 RepID=A0A8J3QDB4_9ACTN|nr:aminoglycoside phosphotransferase family protein [Rhizocola hellebori]GIH08640.1 hypothetical protein Rhe02_67070 [Rhizocola hellebori]